MSAPKLGVNKIINDDDDDTAVISSVYMKRLSELWPFK